MLTRSFMGFAQEDGISKGENFLNEELSCAGDFDAWGACGKKGI